MTFAVDWALSNNYLSITLHCEGTCSWGGRTAGFGFKIKCSSRGRTAGFGVNIKCSISNGFDSYLGTVHFSLFSCISWTGTHAEPHTTKTDKACRCTISMEHICIFCKSMMSLRPVMGVYFQGQKNTRNWVDFPRAEHKEPLNIEM